jgi:hypothetical protein
MFVQIQATTNWRIRHRDRESHTGEACPSITKTVISAHEPINGNHTRRLKCRGIHNTSNESRCFFYPSRGTRMGGASPPPTPLLPVSPRQREANACSTNTTSAHRDMHPSRGCGRSIDCIGPSRSIAPCCDSRAYRRTTQRGHRRLLRSPHRRRPWHA